jgi:hypothetical protein
LEDDPDGLWNSTDKSALPGQTIRVFGVTTANFMELSSTPIPMSAPPTIQSCFKQRKCGLPSDPDLAEITKDVAALNDAAGRRTPPEDAKAR